MFFFFCQECNIGRSATWYKIIKKIVKFEKKREMLIKGHTIEFTVIKSYKIESLVLDKNRTLNITTICYKIHLFSLFANCKLCIAVKVLIFMLHDLLSVF